MGRARIATLGEEESQARSAVDDGNDPFLNESPSRDTRKPDSSSGGSALVVGQLPENDVRTVSAESESRDVRREDAMQRLREAVGADPQRRRPETRPAPRAARRPQPATAGSPDLEWADPVADAVRERALRDEAPSAVEPPSFAGPDWARDEQDATPPDDPVADVSPDNPAEDAVRPVEVQSDDVEIEDVTPGDQNADPIENDEMIVDTIEINPRFDASRREPRSRANSPARVPVRPETQPSPPKDVAKQPASKPGPALAPENTSSPGPGVESAPADSDPAEPDPAEPVSEPVDEAPDFADEPTAPSPDPLLVASGPQFGDDATPEPAPEPEPEDAAQPVDDSPESGEGGTDDPFLFEFSEGAEDVETTLGSVSFDHDQETAESEPRSGWPTWLLVALAGVFGGLAVGMRGKLLRSVLRR